MFLEKRDNFCLKDGWSICTAANPNELDVATVSRNVEDGRKKLQLSASVRFHIKEERMTGPRRLSSDIR